MTKKEYDDLISLLEKEHKEKKLTIAKQFALANNPYKIGDVFEDHNGKIEITSIKFYMGLYSYPSCRYLGVELKKDGTKKKNNPIRVAFQSNDINK